ncbi:hypothetical protein HG535_0C02030 [Zygotorulaspora mrakii]|uniref:Rad61 Wapl domain-containing protein n=1 Tax=Zygotorulaspora mrakii TaxID=42260 RepID=A0A7H9B0H4_ZYGMR|nr:uncharacterized protein HG535_0C02030 [Zygotorulaspora mrakii]QLG71854.1 hypothetical protein HG535_0C02030 [Zygotorulaspora mrakii]
MRAYGKRSSSVAVYYKKLRESEEVEFSDEGDIEVSEIQEDENTPNEDQSSLLSDFSNPCQYAKDYNVDDVEAHSGASIETEDESILVTMATSFDKSVTTSDLKIFDFLEENNSCKKKRKVNYEKKCYDNDGPSSAHTSKSPLEETVEDVNELLSSFQNIDDYSIQKTFQNDLEQLLQASDHEDDGKVTYGRARTMLQGKSDELSIDEQERTIEGNKSRDKVSENRDNVTTHHFNDLKNMGDFLKYQDDLEFLTAEPSINMEIIVFTSKLLNLSLAIRDDEAFLLYILRNNLPRTIKWSFPKILQDPVVLLLQGYLLTRLASNSNDLPDIFHDSVFLMLSQTMVPDCSLIGHKMTRLNFTDFLKQTNDEPAQAYALKLYLMHPTVLSSSGFARKIFNLVGQKKNANLIFQSIETLLTTETKHHIEQNQKEALLLLQKLIRHPEFEKDENYVKSMILLTNGTSILSMLPVQEKIHAYTQSIEFVLLHMEVESGSMFDIRLLHLGLALNIITQCEDIEPQESQWVRARKTLQNADQNGSNEIERFAVHMLYLNLAYMIHRLQKSVSGRERTSIISMLKRFDEETANYNENIHEKINVALHKLL